MANLYYDVRVDIQKDTIIDSGIRLTQGDSKVLFLRIAVTNGGVKFDASNTTPSICFVKPDGTYVVGTPVESGDYWVYQILGNELQSVGKVLCDVKFTYESGRVSSSKFTFFVEKDTTISGAEASSSYVAPMAELLGEMQNYKNQGVSLAEAAAASADIAKLEADRAAAVVGIDIATYTAAGIVKPDPSTLKIEPDGTLKVIGGGGGASGGSVLHVSTTDFIGYPVSVSITDKITGITETQDAVFDADGKASFNLISVGVATITVIDGVTEYTVMCEIKCYSVYEAPEINRFNALINVSVKCGTEGIENAEIIINDIPSGKYTNESGIATISVSEKGIYTIKAKKDDVISESTASVNVQTETTQACAVSFARIKYTFDGNLIAVISSGSFVTSVNTAVSPLIVYVPSNGNYELVGTLNGDEVKANTNVTSYKEFTTSVTVFSATINVTTVTGAEVTATNGTDTFSATATAGVAKIDIGKVGTYTITATLDGVTSGNTATATISSEGEVKNVSIAFASIKLVFDGLLIASVTKGGFTKAINTNESPFMFFVPDTGVYDLTGTLDGEDVEASIEITAYTEKEVTVSASDFYKDWLESASISTSTYTTLEDLLTEGVQNEKDVRKLMTVHASADKLIEWYNDNPSEFPLSTFTSSRIAIKWIGLRDYICDKLMAIEAVKTALLDSEHWEYILKDKVPVMTASNMPYGEASISFTPNTSTPIKNAFDGDNGTACYSNNTNANKNTFKDYAFMYSFVNPICVKRVRTYVKPSSSGSVDQKFRIQATNTPYDANSWVTLHTVSESSTDITESNFNNDNYYLHYRIILDEGNFIGSNGYRAAFNEIQFYGRSLNVGVPVMTSGNKPFGEVSASSGTDPYLVFDKNNNTKWSSLTATDQWIQYDFINPIKVNAMLLRPLYSTNLRVKNFKVMGSNDGVDFEDHVLLIGTFPSSSAEVTRIFNIDNSESFRYYRLHIIDSYTTGNIYIQISELNFFGVDYTEREFESNLSKMYIYDHGVEFAQINAVTDSGKSIVRKDDDSLYIFSYTSTQSGFCTDIPLDGTYKTMRAKSGNIAVINSDTSNSLCVFSTYYTEGTSPSNRISERAIVSNDLPNNIYLDISSCTNGYVGIHGNGNNKVNTITELWLE